MTRRQALKTRIRARERFRRARLAELRLRRGLLSVARQVGNLIKGYDPDGRPERSRPIVAALDRYADLLQPWAQAVVTRTQTEVQQRDSQAWEELARTMGRTLRREVEQAPTGELMRERLRTSVDLITSLPREAAQRVHHLTVEGILQGLRSEEVKEHILQTGRVTEGRARTIARTEVARTSSLLTEARAQYVGSEGYFWRTSGDADVRPEHRRLNGKFIRWEEPPVVDQKSGRRAHAGQDINCRCYMEPVLPEVGVMAQATLRRAA